MRATLALVGALLLVAACGGDAAAGERERLRLVEVVSGLDSPTHVTAPRSEPGKLYVVEAPGRILVVRRGKLRARPFLDIRNLVASGGERGLLSVAFHPRYEENRRLFVDYTDRRGDTRVVEYRANRERTRVLERSARRLLHVRQPYANHNGGQLAFGPDGRLYVGMGDGGSAGDPQNRAQRLSTRLGKLLALNVDRRGARWQIVGYGLRNPWRFSFDRANGRLWLADVGQNQWEEVNTVPRRSPGLENYGWDAYEARAPFEPGNLNRRGRLVFPLVRYGHGPGHCSVTGGFVYRGRAMPAVRGRYFYGDFCSGTVWSLRLRNGKAQGLRREPLRAPTLSSFGEDARGELYLVTLSGTLYRLASR